MKLSITFLCLLIINSAIAANKPEAQQDTSAISAKEALAAYERFKSHNGQWVGKSTKGWANIETISVIARESAIMKVSHGAHPGETMTTMIHMDEDRLLLTHYCVAKNQPRLQATSINKDENTITFTYLDGTNMPSRDKGHMDKVIIRFIDKDHFSEKWTWYQDGNENWMEDIVYERVSDEKSKYSNASTDQIGFDGGLTCVIPVKNLVASKSWYQDVLGFELLLELTAEKFCELASPVNRVTVGLSEVTEFKEGSSTTLTFGVIDIDAARTKMIHKGVKFVGKTEEIPGIVKLATFIDPSGNKLMLYQSLSSDSE